MSRPNKVGLKCPSVQKSFFDINEIWYVGRGRRVIHDGMQYDLIQGREPLKVGNSAIFKGCLLPIYNGGLANDHGFLNWGAIPKVYRAQFLIFVLAFVSRDFKVRSK